MDEFDRQSLHDLRNAVNTACLALDVGLMFLEQKQTDKALRYFKDARTACESCCPLLMRETRRRSPVAHGENTALVGSDRK